MTVSITTCATRTSITTFTSTILTHQDHVHYSYPMPSPLLPAPPAPRPPLVLPLSATNTFISTAITTTTICHYHFHFHWSPDSTITTTSTTITTIACITPDDLIITNMHAIVSQRMAHCHLIQNPLGIILKLKLESPGTYWIQLWIFSRNLHFNELPGDL